MIVERGKSMGVYVENMEMPSCCADCEFCYDMMYCTLLEERMDFKTMNEKRMDGCTLIEVNEKQRYIDRAELFNRLAYIKAPPEANEYKAEVYMLIQSM